MFKFQIIGGTSAAIAKQGIRSDNNLWCGRNFASLTGKTFANQAEESVCSKFSFHFTPASEWWSSFETCSIVEIDIFCFEKKFFNRSIISSVSNQSKLWWGRVLYKRWSHYSRYRCNRGRVCNTARGYYRYS